MEAFAKFENDKYCIRHGKVRDIIEYDTDHLILLATDRISAFDVVMPTLIPDKGKLLTKISGKWFEFFKQIPNAICSVDQSFFLEDFSEVLDRISVQRKAKVLPIEFVVRGYFEGSLWHEYSHGHKATVAHYSIVSGMKHCEELLEPIFTPSTKAEVGQHDENITFEKSVDICADFLGWKKDAALQLMKSLKSLSIRIYSEARAHAITRGIIIADTKFEFGYMDGKIVLIDELLTPDSSRFWSLENYEVGRSQDSMDKQILRNYLQNLVNEGKWNKQSPGPNLPDDLVERIIDRYNEIYEKLFV